jgi:hypothetical protein
MTKISIDLDYEVIDEIVQGQLVRSWEALKDDLGAGRNIFVWGVFLADDVEIQKHLDAFELLIKWYSTPDQLRELGLKVD